MAEPRAGVTGRRIILEIVREMREGLHPLLYSRVAPGLYCVYLHPDDFSRIEGLVPRVRTEAQRALSEEVRRLNAPERPNALRWFVADDPSSPVEEPTGGWVIQIEADRDDEVASGTFVILSKLSLPPLPQFEGGAPTTKVFKTVISGETRTKTAQVFAGAESSAAARLPSVSLPSAPLPSPPPLPPPLPAGVTASAPVSAEAVAPQRSDAVGVGVPVRGLAEIAVQDLHGHRLFVMDKPDIKVGRGGQFRLVDLQIEGSTRISRVHARIRRDDFGRFYIKDLSEWGTTVNGQRIARGVLREGEEVREIDVEAELPPRARIGLAEAVFLEFTAAAATPRRETPAPVQPDADAMADATADPTADAAADTAAFVVAEPNGEGAPEAPAEPALAATAPAAAPDTPPETGRAFGAGGGPS